jgi:hypothetical protein
MRSCSCFILALLLLLLLPTTGHAARVATVVPLGDVQVQPISPVGATESLTQDCQVGNLNPGSWAIGNFLLPPESYSLVFDPAAQCSACPLGIRVEAVHILLQATEATTLDLSVNLQSADVSDPDCPLPGPMECMSAQYGVSLPGAGVFDVSLPLDCDCAFKDYLYLLGVTFENVDSASGAVPDLITDDFPVPCTTYNEFGQGPIDVVSQYNFPGNLLIWADVSCCESPVGDDETSVGRFKGGYED